MPQDAKPSWWKILLHELNEWQHGYGWSSRGSGSGGTYYCGGGGGGQSVGGARILGMPRIMTARVESKVGLYELLDGF